MQQPPVESVTFYQWVTIERLLYGLLILVAVGFRFFLLTDQPLNSLEATNTWTAWLIAQGKPLPMDAAPNSPLLYSLYVLLFWAFGGSDVLARAVPALCGVGTVLLLWHWRNWLGRTAALIAALLIAIDPWSVAYSRLGDSAGITLFLGMLVLTALIRLNLLWNETIDDIDRSNEEGQEPETAEAVAADQRPMLADDNRATLESWQQIAAIALGLLIVSGPQMWNWLVVLTLFILFVLPVSLWNALVRRPSFWALTIGAAIVGATGWLARPEGLSALSTSLSVWFTQWRGDEASYPLTWVLIRLVTDAPLLLLFGLVGLWSGWRGVLAVDGSHRTRFLTAWLLWGILLLLVPGRDPLILGMVGLPLLLLAATGLVVLLQDIGLGLAWRESGLLAVILAILFLSFAFWLASFTNNANFDTVLARTLALLVVLMLLLIVAYALWLDGRQARVVMGSGVGLVLLLWMLGSSWALNVHFDLPYPDGFFASYTNPDARTLASAVETLSAQRHGDAGEMAFQVEMAGAPDPVLGWYLRDMRNLTWVLAPGAVNGQNPPVVITLPGSTGVSGLSASYLGSSYALRDYWLPTQLIGTEASPAPAPATGFIARIQQQLNLVWSARIHNLLRWMIYHKVATLPPNETVVLWVATAEGSGQ